MYFPFDINNYNPEYIKQNRFRILDALGIRISSARRRRNDSQELLAKALGVSKSTVSRYENGDIEIPASILPIISYRYNYSIAQMFGEVSIKGALSEFDNLNFMIINTINAMEKELNDGIQNAAYISMYFSKLINTEAANSFDMFYVISQLMDGINDLQNIKNENERLEKINFLHKNFIDNILIMSQNNYEKTPSVFYRELIEKIGKTILTKELPGNDKYTN